MKYLVQFIVEYNIWEKEKDLKNAKKAVGEFKRRLNTEVGR